MKKFTLTNQNRKYEFLFTYYNIVLINGDSATGKSLFFDDFSNKQVVSHDYDNCLLINMYTKDRLEKLFDGHVYDVVVIDNADLLITPALDMQIFEQVVSLPTKWIIMGRRNYRCVPSPACISELECFEKKYEDKIQYVFKTTYKGMLIL